MALLLLLGSVGVFGHEEVLLQSATPVTPVTPAPVPAPVPTAAQIAAQKFEANYQTKYQKPKATGGADEADNTQRFKDSAKLLMSLKKQFPKVYSFNSSDKDPSIVNDYMMLTTNWSFPTKVEQYDKQTGYLTADHLHNKKEYPIPFWLVKTTNSNPPAPYTASFRDKLQKPAGNAGKGYDELIWAKGATKKFLTTGKIEYGWKFHELAEKQYMKEVKATADGNLTSSTDTTDATFQNKKEKRNDTVTTIDDDYMKSKVYKGKSLKTALLQTKTPVVKSFSTVKTSDDVGFNKVAFNEGSSQTGSIGTGKKIETGTYTNQEGANTISTQEKPKVTAKKTGVVDVEWRGGDSYTTSKMMFGMKKFIKRAARGERW